LQTFKCPTKLSERLVAKLIHGFLGLVRPQPFPTRVILDRCI
jgi:hypothetical protein